MAKAFIPAPSDGPAEERWVIIHARNNRERKPQARRAVL